MPVVYNLRADQVPAPVVPTGIFSPNVASFPTDGTKPPGPPWVSLPVVSRTLPTVWVPVVNTVIAEFDLANRLGAIGGYGIEWGYDLLDLDIFGLPVTQGAASADRPVMLSRLSNTDPTVPVGNPNDIAAHIAAVDNSDSYIWGGAAGSILSPVLGSTTAPAGAFFYLGRAHMASGVLTRDYSGRMFRSPGGLWERITGDAGMPVDAPPAGIRFLQRSRTANGDHLYWWDGAIYRYQQPTGVTTPAQWTADQNDYALPATAGALRPSTDASHNLTGIAGGVDGRMLRIVNVGAQNLVLKDQNAGSVAANRLLLGADVTLAANAASILAYDGITARWRKLV